MLEIGYGDCQRIKHFARQNRKKPTLAERKFRDFLFRHENGVMQGRWKEQFEISGDWLIDFYFPEVRLAIEIDGSIHNTPLQRERDLRKAAALEHHDITLFRLRNDQILAGEQQLRLHMRRAWIAAKNREFHTIGKVVAQDLR